MGIKGGQKCWADGGSPVGLGKAFRSLSALLIQAVLGRQEAPPKLASTHLLQDVQTLSPSVPLNSFLLLRQRAPMLSGLSYCQFVFIKITILARHWEISETTNLVLMKRRH